MISTILVLLLNQPGPVTVNQGRANDGSKDWKVKISNTVPISYPDGGIPVSIPDGSVVLSVTVNYPDSGLPLAIPDGGLRVAFEASQYGVFGPILAQSENIDNQLTFPYDVNQISVTVITDGGVVDAGPPFIILNAGRDGGFARVVSRGTTRYLPGQGIGAKMTFVTNKCDTVNGGYSVIGMLASRNGYGFGCCPDCAADGGSEFAVLRRRAELDGGILNKWTRKSAWSPGCTFAFDETKLHPVAFDFQWLGGGIIRYFLEDPESGFFSLCHADKYTGTEAYTSIANPNLPLSIEVFHGQSMSVPSMSAVRQGPPTSSVLGIRAAASGSQDTPSSATLYPALSVRNPSTYAGRENLTPIKVDLWTKSQPSGGQIQFELVRNAILTNPSFQSQPNRLAQVDVAATAATLSPVGLSPVIMSILSDGDERTQHDLSQLNIMLYPGETLSVIVTRLTGSNTTITTSLSWVEQF